MGEHFRAWSAVFPLILKNREGQTEILLHRRHNTGYQDGKWDIAGSGHVDAYETAQAAVIRECREEVGLEVTPESLTFVHVSHRLSKDRTYYDLYFMVNAYRGTPRIMEPDKCSELKWFALDALPDDIIPIRRQDIQHCLNQTPYSEKIEQ